MKKLFLSIGCMSALMVLGGCPNFASFQGPDTLPSGEGRAGVGITFNQYTLNFGDEPDDEVDGSIPAINAWYRRGITDKLQAHALVWIPFGATIGAKYQLLGNRDSAGLGVAAGFDFGYLTISSGADDSEVSNTIYDLYFPLYVGYRTGPGMSLYAVPKYVLRAVSGDESTLFHYAGGSVGVGLGSSSTFYIEGAFMYEFSNSDSALTGAIGYSF